MEVEIFIDKMNSRQSVVQHTPQHAKDWSYSISGTTSVLLLLGDAIDQQNKAWLTNTLTYRHDIRKCFSTCKRCQYVTFS